jgi:hypothetical protein
VIADADPGEFTTNSLIVTRVIGANNTNLNGCECAPEPASVTAVGGCGEPPGCWAPLNSLASFLRTDYGGGALYASFDGAQGGVGNNMTLSDVVLEQNVAATGE